MDGKYILACVGIVCIAAMECTALLKGVNGVALGAAVAGIGAIAGGAIGYSIGKIQ